MINDRFNFHYIMEKGMVFLCVTQVEHPQKIAFTFLHDIKKEWYRTFGRFESARAGEDEMTAQFEPVLQRKMVLSLVYLLLLPFSLNNNVTLSSPPLSL